MAVASAIGAPAVLLGYDRPGNCVVSFVRNGFVDVCPRQFRKSSNSWFIFSIFLNNAMINENRFNKFSNIILWMNLWLGFVLIQYLTIKQSILYFNYRPSCHRSCFLGWYFSKRPSISKHVGNMNVIPVITKLVSFWRQYPESSLVTVDDLQMQRLKIFHNKTYHYLCHFVL